MEMDFQKPTEYDQPPNMLHSHLLEGSLSAKVQIHQQSTATQKPCHKSTYNSINGINSIEIMSTVAYNSISRVVYLPRQDVTSRGPCTVTGCSGNPWSQAAVVVQYWFADEHAEIPKFHKNSQKNH